MDIYCIVDSNLHDMHRNSDYTLQQEVKKDMKWIILFSNISVLHCTMSLFSVFFICLVMRICHEYVTMTVSTQLWDLCLVVYRFLVFAISDILLTAKLTT
jgi:hypothetical protein